jgi:hypothetical protein
MTWRRNCLSLLLTKVALNVSTVPLQDILRKIFANVVCAKHSKHYCFFNDLSHLPHKLQKQIISFLPLAFNWGNGETDTLESSRILIYLRK